MLWGIRSKERTFHPTSGACVGKVALVGGKVGLDRASVTVSRCRENEIRKYSPGFDALCKFLWRSLVFFGTGVPMPVHRCQLVRCGAVINVLTG